MNKENICENNKRVDHYYKVGDKVMLNNHAAYKNKTPYKGNFMITQCWINGTVAFQCGAIKIRYNIRLINPYTSDTNVEYINFKTNG